MSSTFSIIVPSSRSFFHFPFKKKWLFYLVLLLSYIINTISIVISQSTTKKKPKDEEVEEGEKPWSKRVAIEWNLFAADIPLIYSKKHSVATWLCIELKSNHPFSQSVVVFLWYCWTLLFPIICLKLNFKLFASNDAAEAAMFDSFLMFAHTLSPSSTESAYAENTIQNI